MSVLGNRFARFDPAPAEFTKAVDDTGNLAENFKIARAVADTQRENTAKLLATAEEMIIGITTLQNNMGIEMVKNIPPPTSEVRESPSKSLGYTRLTMRFLQSGLLHFMEQMYQANQEIKALRAHITKLSEYNEEVSLCGELHDVTIDMLEAAVLTPPPSPGQTGSTPAHRQPVEAVKAKTPKDKRSQTPAGKK